MRGLLSKLIVITALVSVSFLLMGGCINPFIGPTVGEAQVHGRVVYSSKIDGYPIPLKDALVTVDNSLENTYTDSNGFYNLAIRYRVGNLAKSAQVTLTVYHDYSSSSATKTVVIKDGFTTIVPLIRLTID